MTPKIRIGYTDKTCRQKLHYPHDSHLLLCAPAGSGKGVSIIVPALMEYQGSCVCIDPKGENAAVCAAELMRQGINVFQINPYNILPEALGHIPAIGYNPLVTLDPRSHGFGSDCDSLAEAICYRATGGDNASFSPIAPDYQSPASSCKLRNRLPRRNVIWSRLTRFFPALSFTNSLRWLATLETYWCVAVSVASRVRSLTKTKS